MSNLYIDTVLDGNRKNTLEIIKPFFNDFTLCGGTGLALLWGHRISNDFDLFSQKPIHPFFLQKITPLFICKKISVNTEDELTFFDRNDVKVTFLFYPFKPLHNDVYYDGVRIGSESDLIANKAYTLGRRVEIRDYIDIYEALKKYSLLQIIQGAKDKFKSGFDEKSFLGQLSYFEGLNFDDSVYIKYGVQTDIFKKTLHDSAKKYLDQN